ncbi:FGGY-family carbohydrate kinase [Thermoleptolyngbya sp. C42_A2020_037]|uniref:FGGY-family carbohydrate kinase n=1 Tax=Thermoleptolyngbya sp. C42_A2020_037 TaxID=2747799 RepID=UPI0019E31851|nr:FGGY-family carbohydrate kinase [Thermoleptolyngbya sp. C42_A2020_037]MBF2086764.1 FGGY-family carbohydrate kinase [Thermoleptolyngbya sp. C42_A2020_037]
MPNATSPSTYLGIDFGTSGARAIATDNSGEILSQTSIPFPNSPAESLTDLWQDTLFALIAQIPAEIRQTLAAIALDGTSSTVLLCDDAGIPLVEPLLYNDSRGAEMLDQVRAIAPPQHTVLSATSSLAKLLWLLSTLPPSPNAPPPHLLHQADWLAFLLHGRLGISDYHNALKLGYDVGELRYPDWLLAANLPVQLPQVKAPGEVIAPILPDLGDRLGIPATCQICAGTTDSIAAFLASGASTPGQAVTSLGSTLVLKLLSTVRVDDAASGIYSHRLGNLWLVGGASNTGGAVLRQFFSDAELAALSAQIDPSRPSPLDYYPLPKPGDRFPINDPNLPPRLEPRPENPVEFLHGLLEGIARIEALGYRRLADLGATPLREVLTAGGGAQNEAWTNVRSRLLQVPVIPSPHTEAAYGTARLARAARQPKVDFGF